MKSLKLPLEAFDNLIDLGQAQRVFYLNELFLKWSLTSENGELGENFAFDRAILVRYQDPTKKPKCLFIY